MASYSLVVTTSVSNNKMAADGRQCDEVFETSLRNVFPTFGLTELKDEQKQALFYLVSGHDVFVNLPTGFGKSLIYELAPFVVKEMCLKKEGKSRSAIVLVISPLISLIKDQVKSLQKKGIKASFIGSGQEEANFKEILTGEINIVYSSPEAMLSNDHWHEMVCSPIYQESVVAVAVDEAHCITHW